MAKPEGRPMDLEDVVLSHPHDFFRLKQLPVVPGTCFVLMPFAAEFQLVYDTIEAGLRGLMVCTRADDLRTGKSILERVLRGIATAELIVADLTGKNPNVFYELALAHTRTKDVLLLTQNLTDVPFDLQALYCHVYRTRSQRDLDALAQTVRQAAEEVMRKRFPQNLEGAVVRTKRIVGYMRQLLAEGRSCAGLLLRVHASYSSLGNIGWPDSSTDELREYSRLLEDERDLLVALVRRGATLHCRLSPGRAPIQGREPDPVRVARLERILAFLRQDGEHLPPRPVV